MCGVRLYLPLDLRTQSRLRNIQIVPWLKIDPELWRCAEVAPKTKRGVNGNAATSQHDVV